MDEFAYKDPDKLDLATRQFIESVVREKYGQQDMNEAAWRHKVGQAAYNYERWMLNAAMQQQVNPTPGNWQEIAQEEWRKFMRGKL